MKPHKKAFLTTIDSQRPFIFLRLAAIVFSYVESSRHVSAGKLTANNYKGYHIVDVPFGVFMKTIDIKVL